MRELKLRMYKPGLGDCFLLSFPTDDNGEFHVMIDCGALSSTDDQLKSVVNDIKARTNGKLDVVVATHEHWDHISGFAQAEKVFSKLNVKNVWASWTEEPGNPQAKVLKDLFKKSKNAVEFAVNKMPDEAADKHLGLYRSAITSLLAFNGGLGVKSSEKTATAWSNYLGLSNQKTYCSPKKPPIELLSVKGVKIFVLGPPEDPSFIRKKLSKVETYDTGAHSFAAFAGFAAAFNSSADSDSEDEKERSFPFDKRYRVLPRTAKRNPFFASHYGFGDKDSNAWRRIDNDWLAQAGELALHLDTYTNNTCFALAIELGEEGKVLLFPGDAQVGNWLSWSKLSWKVKNKNGTFRTVNIDDLLSRTVLYKVGHHGSHNATLRAKGLERMINEDLVAMIPVNRETAKSQKWEFPYPPLWDALRKKCSGRVLLADEADFNGIDADLSSMLSQERIDEFKSSVTQDPLFTEYRISF